VILCGIYASGSVVEAVDKVKYLSVYIKRNSGHSDRGKAGGFTQHLGDVKVE